MTPWPKLENDDLVPAWVVAAPDIAVNAFNVEIDTPDVEVAKSIAASVRERGGGLPGVRAIGVQIGRAGVSQVSTNVHDPFRVPLAEVVAAVRRAAESHDARVLCAEIVGLAPERALEGFPADMEIRGFDGRRQVLEQALGRHV